MPSYNPADIEPRWQAFWEANATFRTPDPGDPSVAGKPKYYILDMFPYPSGSGLHVGHPEGYTATDILARFRRMRGFHVLHPMGWDAFGLPAEQHAIATGEHPSVNTKNNVDNFRRQIKSLGFSYDWQREVNTTDPDYFRWTQWIFLQIYDTWNDPELKKGRPISELPIPPDVTDKRAYVDSHRLAYLAEVPVNWCEALGTVLSNEEVIDGKSERGNHPVVRRPLKQWLMRITAYAERLIDDLEPLDWSESIKQMQRNWIGKSVGAEVEFRLSGSEFRVEVFTTRPDTLFGATYMVLSPEHELVARITTLEQRAAVEAYQSQASRKSDFERTEMAKTKTGVFTGAFAINPVNAKEIPIWIADYVLAGYGTGAIMAVPAHDLRDWDFAQAFKLPIHPVVAPSYPQGIESLYAANLNSSRFTRLSFVMKSERCSTTTDVHASLMSRGVTEQIELHELQDAVAILSRDMKWDPVRDIGQEKSGAGMFLLDEVDCLEGVACNSDFLDGMSTADAKEAMIRWLEENKVGTRKINYKLRDWLFSRQRYWGEPFPILHELDEAGERTGVIRTLEPTDLPLTLPTLADFKPTGSPDGPLAKATDWLTVELDGKKYRRETNTMPQWAGSCWYYLRYIDPQNPQVFADAGKLNHWLPVDLYIGGAEHAVLHLLYSRFWHKVLFDRGYVNCPEPFQKLVNQGMILGEFEYTGYLDGTGQKIDPSGIEENDDGTLCKAIRYPFLNDDGSIHPDPAIDEWNRDRSASRVKLTDEQVKRRQDGFYVWADERSVQVEARSQKMSKSRGNVVNPDDVIAEYGADALRLFEMFMGPLEAVKPWSTKGVEGVYRFLGRVWRLMIDDTAVTVTLNATMKDVPPDRDALRVLHHTIQKVTDDTARLSFNTAISTMMEFCNYFTKLEVRPRAVLEPFVLLLAPYAPHIAEELWAALGHSTTLAYEPWPSYDPEMVKADSIEVPVQVNGKLKTKLQVPAEIDGPGLEVAALADAKVIEALAGKTPKKVIVVPRKLVNIVV